MFVQSVALVVGHFMKDAKKFTIFLRCKVHSFLSDSDIDCISMQ